MAGSLLFVQWIDHSAAWIVSGPKVGFVVTAHVSLALFGRGRSPGVTERSTSLYLPRTSQSKRLAALDKIVATGICNAMVLSACPISSRALKTMPSHASLSMFEVSMKSSSAL
jgi:hypothetical protein